MVTVLIVLVHATVWTTRSIYSNVTFSPPKVWFEDPRFPGVTVELRNSRTEANVTVKPPWIGVDLVGRSGERFDMANETVVFENFEPYPTRGCSYTVIPSGSRILVTGNPAGGLYAGCVLRRRVNIGLVNATVSFIMMTNDATPVDGIRGVVLFNPATGYYYMAGLKNNVTGWFFGIYQYTGRTIREPGGPSLPPIKDVRIGRVAGYWFTVTFSITRLGQNALLKAWLYNVSQNGVLVSYIETTVSNPIPVEGYGVGVYQIRNQPSAVFQMVASTTATTVVTVRGLKYCCYVYIYDSSYNLIGWRHVNETGVVEISLENPVAVYAYMRIVCEGVEYTTSFDVIMGGDVYLAYRRFDGPVLAIHSTLGRDFKGYVAVFDYDCSGDIYFIEIGLWNRTHVTATNAKLIQVNGEVVLINPYSEELLFKPTLNQWVGNVTLKAKMHLGSVCSLKCVFIVLLNDKTWVTLPIHVEIS